MSAQTWILRRCCRLLFVPMIGADNSALLGSPGFQNDGDNETIGIHVSDGDARIAGILGAKIPRPFRDDWRVFYTQQHGDNVTYEIIRASREGGSAQRGDLDNE